MPGSTATEGRVPPRLATLLAVQFALVYPTLIAWAYFVLLAGSGKASPAQQLTYAVGKVVQFSFPLVFVALVERRWPRPTRPWWTGWGLGLAFGLLVDAAILAVYFGWLRHSSLLAATPAKVQEKLREMGLASPVGFFTLAVFLSCIHSLLEEYYWRWFVHGRLRDFLPALPATFISGLGFMAHHVIVLSVFLPGSFWKGVVPLSLGIAVGGWVWAWMYDRTGSLLASWLSHALIDAVIFVIGWDLLHRTAGG